jgi:hypothetical protein
MKSTKTVRGFHSLNGTQYEILTHFNLPYTVKHYEH